MPTSIAIVDDHEMVAEGFANLIQKFDDYEVMFTVGNGPDLLHRLQRGLFPDIVLLDLCLPDVDAGFETATQLFEQHPTVRVLVLTTYDKEEYVVRMMRSGARGYVLKGAHSSELRRALDNIMTKGFYYSDFLSAQLIRSINTPEPAHPSVPFNLKKSELTFLKLACNDDELTYYAIADRMCVSPRTVDGYRESVFQKMGVKSRSGMVKKAIANKLV